MHCTRFVLMSVLWCAVWLHTLPPHVCVVVWCGVAAFPLPCQAIVASHGVFCMLCMITFASYAGVINSELPGSNITSLRYGFGFGLVIILWILSLVTTAWAWKTTDLLPASAWIADKPLGGALRVAVPCSRVRWLRRAMPCSCCAVFVAMGAWMCHARAV